MIIYKCWFCLKEIQQDKFKGKGAGICWKCGKNFVPSPYYEKPESHKYCSKECRYPLFCDNKCKESLKKLLNKWHTMLDYTSYHYNIKTDISARRKNRIFGSIILLLLGVLSIFTLIFILC